MEFTLPDVLAILQAFLVCPLVFVIPGILLGRIANTFSFSTRSTSMRLAISLVLGVSVWPIVVWWLGRSVGLLPAAGLHLLMLAVVVVWAAKSRKGLAKALQTLIGEVWQHRPAFTIAGLWLVIGTALLIDAQVGRQLFTSTAIYDYCKHVAVSDAICRTGIPPDNPMFCPSPPVKLFYYYFWSMLCSLVSVICHPAVVDTRTAATAACLWTGLSLLAATYLAVREIYRDDATVRRRTQQVSILLLWLGGLDILPTLLLGMWYQFGLPLHPLTELPPGVAWWCTQGLVHWPVAILWAPQHVAGFVAGLCGSLLLRRSLLGGKPSSNVIVSGLCFASSLGLSVYVAVTWAAFWALFALVCLYKRNRAALVCLVSSAATAVLLTGLFIFELQAANSRQDAVVGIHLPFAAVGGLEQTSFWALLGFPREVLALLGLAFVPMRWLTGIGLFCFTAAAYWWGRFQTREDRVLLALAGLSLIISTLFHSEVHFDDLGTRALIPAQFVLLLWAARYVAVAQERGTKPFQSRWMLMLLATGILTSAYDCYLLRAFPVFSQFVPSGERVLALRDAYSKLNKLLPAEARTQHNPLRPDFIDVEPYFALYGHHQVVAADPHNGPLFGADEAEYARVSLEVGRMFYGLATAAEMQDICSRRRIDCLVVTDRDPIWTSNKGWMRGREPVVANQHVKAFLVSENRER